MKQYLEQVQQIIDQGCERGDRTGTGTLSVFGMQTGYDLRASEKFGINAETIAYRMKAGWSVEDALTKASRIKNK